MRKNGVDQRVPEPGFAMTSVDQQVLRSWRNQTSATPRLVGPVIYPPILGGVTGGACSHPPPSAWKTAT